MVSSILRAFLFQMSIIDPAEALQSLSVSQELLEKFMSVLLYAF